MTDHPLAPAPAPAGAPVPAHAPAKGPAPQSHRPDSVSGVREAIAEAARKTSVEFDYLLAQAQVESALDPRASAARSSARGLYQFIESTWLAVMKKHGPRFGLGSIASRIAPGSASPAEVSDPATRRAILALRDDPEIAALMAAGLAEDNRAQLLPVLGRQPDHAELYLAHFLGAGGASRFLAEMEADPAQSAAALFRRPASANRAIFYEPGGAARSLAGVMDLLGAKMDRALALSQAGDAGSEGLAGPAISASLIRAAALSLPEQERGEIALPAAGPLASERSAPAPASAPLPIALAAPASPARLTLPPPARPSGPRTGSSGRPAMSSLLAAGFEATGLGGAMSPSSAAQVKRAYAQLRALGL